MARPTHEPLTDPQIKKLSPGTTPIDIRDGELRGLILTILPSGRKQFSVRYRAKGKQRRLTLGEYPGLSLAAARKLARRKLTQIDDGRDLAAEHQQAKLRPTDTVQGLADEYLKRYASKKRSAAEYSRILETYVLPRWRDRSARELTRRDVRVLVEGIADRGAPIMANRVLACVRRMLNFGIDREWIDANPAARLAKPGEEQSRDRVLTDEEIRKLWRCLSRKAETDERPAPGRKAKPRDPNDPPCPISPALAAVQKVRLLTAQRGGEVILMRWQDLDLNAGWWTIPGIYTKNGEAHRVPLTKDAIGIIKAQRKDDSSGEYVFVGRGETLKDRAKKAPALLARTLGFEFRGHDLRRTASTKMTEAGIPREHVAKLLNHVEGGARATKVYDRYAYDREKRIAVETWDRTLKAILSEQPQPAEVVPISGGRNAG